MVAVAYHPMRLTWEYSGLAGGGTCELTIEASDAGLLVAYDTGLDADSKVVVASSSLEDGWRSTLRAVAAYTGKALDNADADLADGRYFPRPDCINVSGPDNFAADLVAYAFGGDPLAQLAVDIAGLSDEQLSTFRADVGSLREWSFVRRVLKLSQRLQEVDLTFRDVVTELERNGVTAGAIFRVGASRVASARRAARRAADRRAQTLAAMSDEIQRFMQPFRKQFEPDSGPVGTHTAMRSGLRRAHGAAVQSYVEEHFLRYGCGPTGHHRVTGRAFNGPFSLDLDFGSGSGVGEVRQR